MSSWFSIIPWGPATEEITDVDINDAMGKLQHCSEQQQQLVDIVLSEIRREIARKQQLFANGDDESGQILVRRCVWACHHFKSVDNIVRNAIEIINWAVRPVKPTDPASGGVNYLHLVYSSVLLEPFASESAKYNLNVIFDLFTLADPMIHFTCLCIIHSLVLNNKTVNLQNIVLSDPMAISSLVELLDNERDGIRRLALLVVLTMTEVRQQELQKLVAFSGGFEKAFQMIQTSSSWSDNGETCVDCLKLIKNLLKNNVSNQNYFRETSCIPRLVSLIDMESSDTWMLTDQKKHIVLASLDIIILLVSGTNPSIALNQTEMGNKWGIFERVVLWALDRVNSPEVRSKALRALGGILKHHSLNRAIFSQKTVCIAREKTPQPTLHRLLTLALHSGHLSERISSTFTFQCFLSDNAENQLALITTLTPPPDNSVLSAMTDPHAGANSIGRQLLSALNSLEDATVAPHPPPSPAPLSTSSTVVTLQQEINGHGSSAFRCWTACCMLAAILADNNDCKLFALRIQLYLDKAETLLSVCMKNLQLQQASIGVHEQIEPCLSQVGIVRLLCVWMVDCPPVVCEFLSHSEYLPFVVDIVIQPEGNVHLQGICALLIGFCFMFNKEEDEVQEDLSKVAQSRAALHAMILHRIGLEKFVQKLEALRTSNSFVIVEKQDADCDFILGPAKSADLVYDADFVEFFKKYYEQLLRELKSPNKRDRISGSQLKEKETEINKLLKKIASLEERLATLAAEKSDLEAKVILSGDLTAANQRINDLETELELKEDTLQSLSSAYNLLEQTIRDNQGHSVLPNSSKGDDANSEKVELLAAQNLAFEQQLKDLNQQFQLVLQENKELKEQLTIQHTNNAKELEELTLQLQEANSTTSKKIKESESTQAADQTINNSNKPADDNSNSLIAVIDDLQNKLDNTQRQLEESLQKYAILEKEQVELLILLAQEEMKNQ